MKKKVKEDFRQKIKDAWERWQYILEHGTSDPLWADGVNMNLVRNHILYYQNQIREEEAEQKQLSLFDIGDEDDSVWEVPPRVPMNYIAPNPDYPDRWVIREMLDNGTAVRSIV